MSKSIKPLGLGKGLSAIFETELQNTPAAVATTSFEVELSKIHPNEGQPRTNFDKEALEELASSIKRLGVIQPITVRETSEDSYEIVSGERRYRASKMAGLSTIPAYVRRVEDSELLEMALVENVQREELGVMEIALTIKRLIEELGITQQALGESIGKRRSTVANYLRLLSLSPMVQSALRDEVITMGHAKVLASLAEEDSQESMLAVIIAKGLSVRATEELLTQKSKPKANKTTSEFVYVEHRKRLEEIYGAKRIKLQESGKGGGKVVISFKSEAELEEILNSMKK
ncbi:MAG: ParB/RepB/Spo0J family partition protein [Rikenellaceae bacterium]